MHAKIGDYFSDRNIAGRAQAWEDMQRIYYAIGRNEGFETFQGAESVTERMPYYYIPPNVLSDERLEHIASGDSFWHELIGTHVAETWANDVPRDPEHPPTCSVNMIIYDKRLPHLYDRLEEMAQWQAELDENFEFVLGIGHPITTRQFDEVKAACAKCPFPVKIILQNTAAPNISRNLTTIFSEAPNRIIIDDDCFLPLETVRGFLDTLHRNPEIMAVGARSYNPGNVYHKPQTDFPQYPHPEHPEWLGVPGIHGMAFAIRGKAMDNHPIPPRIGNRGDWLPFFASVGGQGYGDMVYDMSLPPIEHRYDRHNIGETVSITRSTAKGVNALLSMMHTLYESGDSIYPLTVADHYLRTHYLGENLDAGKGNTWLSRVWNNLKKTLTQPDFFEQGREAAFDHIMEGITVAEIGHRNVALFASAIDQFFDHKAVAISSKDLIKRTSGKLLPPFRMIDLYRMDKELGEEIAAMQGQPFSPKVADLRGRCSLFLTMTDQYGPERFERSRKTAAEFMEAYSDQQEAITERAYARQTNIVLHPRKGIFQSQEINRM
jgi:hypothetical protein